MKKLIITMAFFGVLSTQAQDYKSDTIAFIKKTGSTALFDQAISQVGMMVPEDKKDAYTIEATGTLEDLYTQLADLYMKEFSEEEIKTLNTFYESDLGKKLASKQTVLTQQGMVIGQSWAMKLQEVAKKYAQ